MYGFEPIINNFVFVGIIVAMIILLVLLYIMLCNVVTMKVSKMDNNDLCIYVPLSMKQ